MRKRVVIFKAACKGSSLVHLTCLWLSYCSQVLQIFHPLLQQEKHLEVEKLVIKNGDTFKKLLLKKKSGTWKNELLLFGMSHSPKLTLVPCFTVMVRGVNETVPGTVPGLLHPCLAFSLLTSVSSTPWDTRSNHWWFPGSHQSGQNAL